MVATVRGNAATIRLANKDHSVWGISDFSISFDRGTVEQELVGEEGNPFMEGALSIDGSFTACKFGASGNSDIIDSIVNGDIISVSGAVSGSTHLRWYFASCQITGYDITIGDASTVTEASIDFAVLDPYNVTYDSNTGKVSD